MKINNMEILVKMKMSLLIRYKLPTALVKEMVVQNSLLLENVLNVI
jgi:hypothetical protein